MSGPYDEIIKMFSDIEKEMGITSGTLQKLYDLERVHVHLYSRNQIQPDIRRIIVESARGEKDNN